MIQFLIRRKSMKRPTFIFATVTFKDWPVFEAVHLMLRSLLYIRIYLALPATSSADGTLKLWTLSDFSCIKSIDAHDASVLSIAFVTRGMQIVSAGADGLVKVRNSRSVMDSRR